MSAENLAYALVQLVHNFGAAGVVGAAVFACWPVRQAIIVQARLAWLVLFAWAVQIASGASFGAVSYHFYGTLPELHAIARAALVIKVAAALVGLASAAWLVARGAHSNDARRLRAWRLLAACGVIALAAAAALRWFS